MNINSELYTLLVTHAALHSQEYIRDGDSIEIETCIFCSHENGEHSRDCLHSKAKIEYDKIHGLSIGEQS